eukprot:TRINITY_DN8696_c0_g1_i1.p1 TRINITY_DN8696_c0_g1~~TRINITY_DN8696_c0_g1_i1.p1  ORF type:complete len:342 (-),score=52.88 TRINITY_DN8696_c0_g1_i1:39-1064(-)
MESALVFTQPHLLKEPKVDFVNAVLLCLLHIPKLVSGVLEGVESESFSTSQSTSSYNGEVALGFAQLIKSIVAGDDSPDCSLLLEACAKHGFTGGDAGDAEVFLLNIIDGLKEDLSLGGTLADEVGDGLIFDNDPERLLSMPSSIATKLFFGLSSSELLCAKCENILSSRLQEEVRVIARPNADLHTQDLMELLAVSERDFIEVGELDPTCTHCNAKHGRYMGHSLYHLPQSLIIGVRRVVFNFETYKMDKVNTLLDCPPVLDLSPFVSVAAPCLSRPLTYNIQGFIAHISDGGMEGAYAAYVKQADGTWLVSMYGRVQSVSQSLAMRKSRMAFILFYDKQ